MSEFPFWVSSLSQNRFALNQPASCVIWARSHTLPAYATLVLFYFSLCLARSLFGFTMQGRVVSFRGLFTPACSCRRRRWLSQKHSDRGIVSARGTLGNQCSSLPRRVRLCSKPSTDCISLSLSLWDTQPHCEKERKTNPENSTTWSVQQSEPLDYRARFSKTNTKHTTRIQNIQVIFIWNI